MKTKIYCKTQEKGVHTFYLNKDGRIYYLFSQDYRKGVSKYYEWHIEWKSTMYLEQWRGLYR